MSSDRIILPYKIKKKDIDSDIFSAFTGFFLTKFNLYD